MRRLIRISHGWVNFLAFITFAKFVPWFVLGLGTDATVGDCGVPVFLFEELVVSLSLYSLQWSVQALPVLVIFEFEGLLVWAHGLMLLLKTGIFFPTGCMRIRSPIITSG